MKETEFLRYKIRKGDTLDSIANRMQIHPVDLKFFHNERCSLSERIHFEHLQGVEYFFIPTNYKNDERLEKENANERPSVKFRKEFYQKEYVVTESFLTEKQLETFLESRITIDFKKDEDERNILLFHQTDFTSNGKKLESKTSLLGLESIKTIYPLPFILNEKGYPTSILEPKELLKSFQTKRTELEELYIGEPTRLYLDKFEKSLENEEYFFEQFSSTLLFQLLFPRKEFFFHQQKFNSYFYVVPNSFAVQFICEAEFNHDNKDFVLTTIKGYADDSSSLEEVLTGVKSDEQAEVPLKAELNICYKTAKKTKQLLEVESTIFLYQEDEVYHHYQLNIQPNYTI